MRPDAAKQGTRAPATMTAVWHDRYGPPEVLATVSGVEVPTPGADQVLVRVHTAGVSRGVTHLTSGLPRLVRLASGVRKPRQAVPGMDVCGTIVGVGSQVTGLAVACQRDGTTVLPRGWDHLEVLSSMADLVSGVNGDAPALPVGGAFDDEGVRA